MSNFDKAKEKLKEKKLQQKEEMQKLYSADFENLVDLVEVGGKTKFLTYDKRILDKVEIDGQTFFPPEVVSWLLPNAEKVLSLITKHSDDSDSSDAKLPQGQCNACNDLYLSIIDYFKTFSEMLTEYHYHFLTQMAFHSHLIEKFNYSPILFLVGDGGRGKTPTLKALAAISRRGVFTETFREANIIRWGGDYKASLFLDTKNFPKKVEFANCEDVIYGRAERGVEAARVLFPEKGAFRDMKSFSTFGVTGATSNFMVDDLTEMRCVVFHLPFSPKVFNIDPTPELGLDLKNELTAFRLVHFNKPFVNLEKQSPGKMENYLIGIHQMVKTHFPQFEKDYLFFKEEVKEEKLETAESGFGARIIKLIILLEQSVEEGTLCLTYENICEQYNKDATKNIYPKSMSSILKGLGFRSRRNAAGNLRGIFYDEVLIKHLCKAYGLEGGWGNSSSESSEESETTPNDSENTQYFQKELPKETKNDFETLEREAGEKAVYELQQEGIKQQKEREAQGCKHCAPLATKPLICYFCKTEYPKVVRGNAINAVSPTRADKELQASGGSPQKDKEVSEINKLPGLEHLKL